MEYRSPLFFLLALLIDILGRICQRDAFAFNKNKRRQKEDQKQRVLLHRIFGIYSLRVTEAPRHMVKYTVIRVVNVGLTIVHIVFVGCVSPGNFQDIAAIICLLLQQLLLLFPLFLDAVLLSKPNGQGKELDFSRSRRP